MKTTIYLLLLTGIIFISGCALTYKFGSHYTQGEQVYVQHVDGCCNYDKFGEIAYPPSSKDSLGHILYYVRLRNHFVMQFPENVLDSLNSNFY